MRRPVPKPAMMKKAAIDSWFPEKPTSKNPRSNFQICFSSDPDLSDSPPPSPGTAGDVSAPVSPLSSQCAVDDWGDTFVQETPDAAGDVAAGGSEVARWAGCIAPDSIDGFCDLGSMLHVPTPVEKEQILSSQTRVDAAVAEEEKKQVIWEEKMLKMLGRMKAKADRQFLERVEASASITLAEENDEKKWDKKIGDMHARMKAKESAQKFKKMKS